MYMICYIYIYIYILYIYVYIYIYIYMYVYATQGAPDLLLGALGRRPPGEEARSDMLHMRNLLCWLETRLGITLSYL